MGSTPRILPTPGLMPFPAFTAVGSSCHGAVTPRVGSASLRPSCLSSILPICRLGWRMIFQCAGKHIILKANPTPVAFLGRAFCQVDGGCGALKILRESPSLRAIKGRVLVTRLSSIFTGCLLHCAGISSGVCCCSIMIRKISLSPPPLAGGIGNVGLTSSFLSLWWSAARLCRHRIWSIVLIFLRFSHDGWADADGVPPRCLVTMIAVRGVRHCWLRIWRHYVI